MFSLGVVDRKEKEMQIIAGPCQHETLEPSLEISTSNNNNKGILCNFKREMK